MNENWNTAYQKALAEAKAGHRENFIAVSVHIKYEKRSQLHNLNFCFKKLIM